MRLLQVILLLTAMIARSQPLTITTLDKTRILVTIITDSAKHRILQQFDGRMEDSLRKKFTARTWLLSNGQILMEFYDRQAALIDNKADFLHLDRVRFVKNNIGILKKNVSYIIECSPDEAENIIQQEHPIRRTDLKSEYPDIFDFEIYELSTGQVLYIDKSLYPVNPILCEDLKTLASESESAGEAIYGHQDSEHFMKKLASGDPMADYDLKEWLIYPKYIPDVIHNHELTLVEQKVYVEQVYGNLYKSLHGYYVLVNEIDQQNGAGDKLKILTLRIYDSVQQVRTAQKAYANSKDKPMQSEHFYQRTSDKYGKDFPRFVPQLIDSLSTLVNIDKAQLTLDSTGLALLNVAIKWNDTNDAFFDSCFPSILAFYGQSYISNVPGSKWFMYLDKKSNIWVPEVIRHNGKEAWDWIDFYKMLAENSEILTLPSNSSPGPATRPHSP